MNKLSKVLLLSAMTTTLSLSATDLNMSLADFLKLPQGEQQSILTNGVNTQEAEQIVFDYDSFFASDHKDNGGDGIEQENGEIVLRDFIRNNYVNEKKAQDVLNSYPEVRALFNKLAIKAPYATELLWNKFDKLTFHFVDGELPLLPSTQTGFDLRTADIQIAIKRDKNVLISTPAFNKTRDREYLIIHEILHDMVKVEGDWTALKHTKVREITNYIKDNIDHLDQTELGALFKESVKLSDYGYQYGFESILDDESSKAAAFILNTKNNSVSRCDLYQYYTKSYASFNLDYDVMRALYNEHEKCFLRPLSKSPLLSELKTKYPNLYKYQLERGRKHYPLHPVSTTSKHQSREEKLESCQSNASKKRGQEITEQQQLLKLVISESTQMRNNGLTQSSISDHVERVLFERVNKDFEIMNKYNVPAYNKSVKKCQELFSLRRFYN